MAAESKKEIELEIAHVLFIDIVGYSKLSANQQHAAVEELNQIVRASEQFQKAEAANRILKIPTGDGMALVFYRSPEEPAQCAFEISGAQEVGGDHAAAQESWRQALNELESFLKEQPDNYALIGDMALTSVALGDKAAALALAQRAIATRPLEKDAIDGSVALDFLARVSAQAGEPDRAITAIQKLLSIPGGGSFSVGIPLTPALLRLDPMFDPLRNDPRFQKLIASAAPQ